MISLPYALWIAASLSIGATAQPSHSNHSARPEGRVLIAAFQRVPKGQPFNARRSARDAKHWDIVLSPAKVVHGPTWAIRGSIVGGVVKLTLTGSVLRHGVPSTAFAAAVHALVNVGRLSFPCLISIQSDRQGTLVSFNRLPLTPGAYCLVIVGRSGKNVRIVQGD